MFKNEVTNRRKKQKDLIFEPKKKILRNGLRDKRHELTISIFANVEHRLLSRLFNVIGVRPLF